MTIEPKRTEYIHALANGASDHAFSAIRVKEKYDTDKYNAGIKALNEFFSTAQEEFQKNKLSSSDSSNTDVRNRLIAEIETAQSWINAELPDSDPAREHLRDKICNAIEFVRTQFVVSNTSPEELHQLVLNYSVHYHGIDTMVDVVRNQYCDKNTALYVFWDLSPADFFLGYERREDIASYNHDDRTRWDLINHIIFKVIKSSFAEAKMAEDYKKVIYPDSLPKNSKWEIPHQLFGEEGEYSGEVKEYDANFDDYGPHCYQCKKPVESLTKLGSCPYCDKSFLCECAYCREYRGEG